MMVGRPLLLAVTCASLCACASKRTPAANEPAPREPAPQPRTAEAPAPAAPLPSPEVKPEPSVATGAKRFETFGCNACHSPDGTPRAFGTMYRFFGSTIEVGAGETLVVDAAYIRRVILDPATANGRPGWRLQMPSYRGTIGDADIDHLIAYIASLR